MLVPGRLSKTISSKENNLSEEIITLLLGTDYLWTIYGLSTGLYGKKNGSIRLKKQETSYSMFLIPFLFLKPFIN